MPEKNAPRASNAHCQGCKFTGRNIADGGEFVAHIRSGTEKGAYPDSRIGAPVSDPARSEIYLEMRQTGDRRSESLTVEFVRAEQTPYKCLQQT
jgi:hypothetical protein